MTKPNEVTTELLEDIITRSAFREWLTEQSEDFDMSSIRRNASSCAIAKYVSDTLSNVDHEYRPYVSMDEIYVYEDGNTRCLLSLHGLPNWTENFIDEFDSYSGRFLTPAEALVILDNV